MKLWTSDDLTDVYRRLLGANIHFVIIGGQAVNLWSQSYERRATLPSAAWAELQPFSSRDLDLLGGRLEAVAAATAFDVEAVLFDAASRLAIPNAATLYVPLAGEELVIQFLHTPFGARREEIRSTARILEWDGNALPVMHPVLCLESKLECLYGLDQQGRQDLRHLRLSILCVHGFLTDLLSQGDQRGVLGALERIAAIAADDFGLRLWLDHGLEIETALPMSALEEGLTRLPKLATFFEKHWPQLKDRLAARRVRFSELAARDKRAHRPPSKNSSP